MTQSPYEKIGMGNPRLDSAIQILKDLNLLYVDPEDGAVKVSDDGTGLLGTAIPAEITS